MSNPISSDHLKEVIVSGIQEVKGKDISVIDMQTIDNAICDYFVLCSYMSVPFIFG